jgi:AcrR family transcriptional regulator
MPKQTFLKLKSAKRHDFLEVAIREFANHDYNGASVSRIVATLGIAKGSVYQYFRDKRDLYTYLLEVATQRKLEYMREQAADGLPSRDFFNIYRKMILAGAEFDFRNPDCGLLVLNAVRNQRDVALDPLVRELRDRSTAFLLGYLRRAIQHDSVRSDLELSLLATFLNSASLTIGTHMEQKYGFSLAGQLAHPERPLPFGQAQLENEVDAVIEVIRHGIAPPGAAGGQGKPPSEAR